MQKKKKTTFFSLTLSAKGINLTTLLQASGSPTFILCVNTQRWLLRATESIKIMTLSGVEMAEELGNKNG